jgi:hypothetical protein
MLRRRVDGIQLAPFEQGQIGPELFRAACDMRLEGIVSKHRDQPYRAGPSRHLVKVKNRKSPSMNRPEGMFGRTPLNHIGQFRQREREPVLCVMRINQANGQSSFPLILRAQKNPPGVNRRLIALPGKSRGFRCPDRLDDLPRDPLGRFDVHEATGIPGSSLRIMSRDRGW